jgi:endonuclease/exonuclease/phosphatase family metal-dependent hydrolase
MRVLSWNLLRRRGARVEDIRRLVETHRPDLVLLQEATAGIDALPDVLGGSYARREMKGRGHGPAVWSLRPFTAEVVPLPPATRVDFPVPLRRLIGRIALVVRLDGNNAELGRRILNDAALPGLEQVDTMDGAARRAAELAAK